MDVFTILSLLLGAVGRLASAIWGRMLLLKYSISTTLCVCFSSELERYQFEKQRLRERVRELTEQNVSLQREVSSFHKRDAQSRQSEVQKLSGAMQSEVIKHGLDGYFVVESEMKVQKLKHGIENLTRSLQQIFVLLHDKSTPAASISQWKIMDANGIMQSKRPTSEDVMKYELKEETVQTCLLRQKLYSNEQEVEQLQAELSTVWKYAEMNVLLNQEVAELKDKVHDLQEEVLLMDGQITNLKDALVKQSKRLLMEQGKHQGKRRCWGVSFPQNTPLNGMIQ